MLDQSRVLQYIKQNLGFPFNPIEMEDPEILDYNINYTLREFSHFIPQVRRIGLNMDDPTLKVPNTKNEFYIVDPDNIEILNIVDMYFDKSDLIFLGHPIMGAFSQSDLPGWFLDVETSIQTKLYSSFDKTYEFIHPNIVRISPVSEAVSYCTVEYERMQPPDLSGIPNEFQTLYCQLSLADIQIVLGTMRRRYSGGNLRTPFGEIPVDTEILADGKELKREIIDKLTVGTYTNVVFDHG